MNISIAFQNHYLEQPTYLARAPGRVNLLGEHVDYNAGVVLPAAIDRSVTIAACKTDDRLVSLSALDLGEEVVFSLDQLEAKKGLTDSPLPGWALYPAGVAWALQERGLAVAGMKAVFTSDVPIGAGLSSSAAVEVAFAALWEQMSDWRIDRLELAIVCQRSENEYVGVSCGLMDQFACANGVQGHAIYFDTRSLEHHPVPLPQETTIVIADSGVRRSLTNSAYNERRAACEQAVALLRKYIPDLRSLRDVSPPEFAAYSVYLPEMISLRAEHVVKEIARVQSAITALNRNDARAFGALMYAGHASLRDLYEVSTIELDTLVEIARSLPGCYGARLTGAGFGGCTVNLVNTHQTELFIQQLIDGYQQRTSRTARVFRCQASQGAEVMQLSG